VSHRHVGPEDYACDGCIKEADERQARRERAGAVAGYLFLILLVIAGLAALSAAMSSCGGGLP
jgi:hypothetical protein